MGVILSNTTIARPGIQTEEMGGLSGRPLGPMTREAVESATSRRLAVVASGGIGDAADVVSLRSAGADLVQLWTGMIYAGPGLIGEAIRAATEAAADAGRPPT